MRRPRAFTCSRIRAEPLPPPARHLQGYYKTLEDDYATVVRSSGCNCGTCSSHSRAADQRITRLPQSAVGGQSSRHGQGRWPTVKANCQAVVTPSQSFEYTASDKSRPGRIMPARGPAHRMPFNPKLDEVSIRTCDVKATGGTFSGTASARSSERKRGSDRNDSIGALGKGPSSVTDGSDTCVETASAAHRFAGKVCSGPIACPPVQTAARPGYGSKGVSRESVPQGGQPPCFQTREGLSLSTANRSTAEAKVRSLGVGGSTVVPINKETPSNLTSPANLEEWKAPETEGTFSLGASSKETTRGRRRRTLRMRVGG